jgi:hypothetical protein
MKPPLLKGGQGRSDADVADSAMAIVWPWVWLACFLLAAALYWLAFGGR